uniref:Uncharacterized protein n=1 Tax=Setaria digitata TaxID=48799 RepID=A0A915PGL5_9BILA
MIYKLYCRNGQSYIPETRVPTLCPTSSTSCGYFEFDKLSLPGGEEEQLGIYECIDSSILMPDNDDSEEQKQLLFSKYCDDQARCREITLSAFNPKFVQYLIRKDKDKLQNLLNRRIKFCCAINDHLLQRIIHFGDYVLPTLAPPEPIICNNIRCRGVPIGCLTYLRHNETVKEPDDEDMVFVQPVHVNYEDYTVLPPQPVNNKYLIRSNIEHHCVYRHFNDEMYRYCLLIQDQPSNDQCFYGDDYQICCCFLHRGAQTCDPLSARTITTATTEIPTIIPNKSIISITNNKIMDVNTKVRTRCRITDEISSESGTSINRPRRKKLLCETGVINLSHKSYFHYILMTFCYFTVNYSNLFVSI